MKKAAPTKQQQRHANKITHRSADGKFKDPPSLNPKEPPPTIAKKKKVLPAELDQDGGGGYNANNDEIQT